MAENSKIRPEISVLYAQIMRFIGHIPPEPKAQLGQALRQILLQISQASHWEAPVAQPPAQNEKGTKND